MRDIGDLPGDADRHGGNRGAHWQDERDLRWGGWSPADYWIIGLLVTLLAVTTLVLLIAVLGWCDCS